MKLAGGLVVGGHPLPRLRDLLDEAISEMGDVDIVSAYFNSLTFSLPSAWLGERLSEDASVRLLLGANAPIRPTAAQAAVGLLASHGARASIRMLRVPSGVFHPKMVIVRNSDGSPATLSVGSSNVTDGGLDKNAEINIVLDTQDDGFAEVAAQLSAHFDHLWGLASPLDMAFWQERAESSEPTLTASRVPVPSYLGTIAKLGAPSDTDQIDLIVDTTSPSEHVLLIQLTSSEVEREPWVPDAQGTASPNLPSDDPFVVSLFESHLEGHDPAVLGGGHHSNFVPLTSIGVAALRGQSHLATVNLWSRWRRGTYAERRFSWPMGSRRFLGEDLGRAPVEGDVVTIRWSQTGDTLIGSIDVSLLAADSPGVQEALADGSPRDHGGVYVLLDRLPSSLSLEDEGVL